MPFLYSLPSSERLLDELQNNIFGVVPVSHTPETSHDCTGGLLLRWGGCPTCGGGVANVFPGGLDTVSGLSSRLQC